MLFQGRETADAELGVSLGGPLNDMRTGLLALARALLGPTGSGQDTAPSTPDAQALDDQVRPYLAKHCQECHGPEKPKGNFRLAQLSDRNSAASWHSVLEQIQSGDMPPKKKARPPQADTKAALDHIRRAPAR